MLSELQIQNIAVIKEAVLTFTDGFNVMTGETGAGKSNTIYTLFETFGIVHAVTQGGPSRATETLIYKVFNDGFIGLDFGGSSAQSVVLMFIVMILTFLQFRYIERKVNY